MNQCLKKLIFFASIFLITGFSGSSLYAKNPVVKNFEKMEIDVLSVFGDRKKSNAPSILIKRSYYEGDTDLYEISTFGEPENLLLLKVVNEHVQLGRVNKRGNIITIPILKRKNKPGLPSPLIPALYRFDLDSRGLSTLEVGIQLKGRRLSNIYALKDGIIASFFKYERLLLDYYSYEGVLLNQWDLPTSVDSQSGIMDVVEYGESLYILVRERGSRGNFGGIANWITGYKEKVKVYEIDPEGNEKDLDLSFEHLVSGIIDSVQFETKLSNGLNLKLRTYKAAVLKNFFYGTEPSIQYLNLQDKRITYVKTLDRDGFTGRVIVDIAELCGNELFVVEKQGDPKNKKKFNQYFIDLDSEEEIARDLFPNINSNNRYEEIFIKSVRLNRNNSDLYLIVDYVAWNKSADGDSLVQEEGVQMFSQKVNC